MTLYHIEKFTKGQWQTLMGSGSAMAIGNLENARNFVKFFLEDSVVQGIGVAKRNVNDTYRIVESQTGIDYRIFPPPDPEEMIEKIVEDLDNWMKSDPSGCMDHFRKLERERLRNMTEDELVKEYDNLN